MGTAIGVLFIVLLAVSGSAALYARTRRGVPLGLGVKDGAGREIALGLLIGAVCMTATVLAVTVSTATRLGAVRWDWDRLGYGIALLVVAAVGEELVYRALMLGGLAFLIRRPWPALIGSALVFGLVHLTDSPDATAVSVASNTLGGVMYGVAFLRTGRIWMSVGLHFAWNFTQGTLLGFPISDETAYSSAVFHPVVSGPTWLTGGAYGPEGSVWSLVFRCVIIAAVLAATRGGTPARSG